jgi:hypothetical protein
MLKGAVVFFGLVGGYFILRFLIPEIKKTTMEDQESSGANS